MDIHSRIVRFIDAKAPFCVVVALSAEGSTPRETGVKAVVDATGRIFGTIGGGALEAEAQRAAVEACRSGQAAVIEAALIGDSTADRDPLCGGAMRLLIDPTATKDAAAYAAAAVARRKRHKGLLLTAVREGVGIETEVTWYPEGEVLAPDWSHDLIDAPTAQACLEDRRARLVSRGEADTPVAVLVEPVIPDPRLLIAGGGHIGQALAAQAALVGFDVTVIDDRCEFTESALFPPGLTTECADIARTLAESSAGDDTYVVIVTRGHQHDADALRACVGRPFAYLGMIGSRRKVALIRQSLIESGAATEAELDRVHAPIGLDIGAETVPEIAASIVAQLIAVRRQGSADPCPRNMRDR